MLIGIAGRTGAGKNCAATILENHGWRTLDLDVVAHQVLNQMGPKIADEFGLDMVDSEGCVIRSRLSAKIFASPQLVEKLESMTYPLIEEKTLAWIKQNQPSNMAIHAINLHKTQLPQHCRYILWIHAGSILRRIRVMKREKKSWQSLKSRFRYQNTLNPKLFAENAEILIVKNSGNVKKLEEQLLSIPELLK